MARPDKTKDKSQQDYHDHALIYPQSNLREAEKTVPTSFTRGEGIYVFDDNGNRYLEAASGLWCASLGFGVERLAQMAYEAMSRIGYYHIFRSASHPAAVELARRLLAIAPVPMSKVLFQCSGSEANDAAVKLVRYYWNAKAAPKRTKIISRRLAYHGATLAATSLSGKPEMHSGFDLPLDGFLHTECPYYYRLHEEGETEKQFSSRMAAALEDLIVAEGPEQVAAFWAEPVMGSGGAILPPHGYFEAIQKVLRKYDILFVADEIICGFGRTGDLWGSETYGLQPDMITCGKSLSAGLQPISALLMNQRVYDAMLEQSDRVGLFAHGSTYAGHPVTAAVALGALDIYEELDVVGNARRVGSVFRDLLEGLKDHPLVGDTSAIGLIGGVEVVEDKRRRAPHPARLDVPVLLDRAARSCGLIVRTIRNRIALSPPLIITESEIVDLMTRLRRALDLTAKELRSRVASGVDLTRTGGPGVQRKRSSPTAGMSRTETHGA